MRARAGASACAPSVRLPDRQLRLRSLVLLPAVVAAAAAIHMPAALALSGDLRSQGTVSSTQAERSVVEPDEQAQPCRRAGRRHASVRRGWRQARAAGRRRPRLAAARPARTRPRVVQAALRLAGPTAEVVPLEQRSLVASHPLAPDPIAGPGRAFPGDPVPVAHSEVPRSRSTHPNAFALAVAGLARELHPSEPAMVEGAWPHCRGARQPQSSWRLASLGPAFHAPHPSISPSLSDGPIHWRASASCLASPLRAILDLVAAEFGPLTVNSTCRSRAHNARVGGASRSYHLTGDAVDFRVRSSFGEVLAFLNRLGSVGGLTHYGAGVFHIDTGPRRTWGPRSWGRQRVRSRVARRA